MPRRLAAVLKLGVFMSAQRMECPMGIPSAGVQKFPLDVFLFQDMKKFCEVISILDLQTTCLLLEMKLFGVNNLLPFLICGSQGHTSF